MAGRSCTPPSSRSRRALRPPSPGIVWCRCGRRRRRRRRPCAAPSVEPDHGRPLPVARVRRAVDRATWAQSRAKSQSRRGDDVWASYQDAGSYCSTRTSLHTRDLRSGPYGIDPLWAGWWESPVSLRHQVIVINQSKLPPPPPFKPPIFKPENRPYLIAYCPSCRYVAGITSLSTLGF